MNPKFLLARPVLLGLMLIFARAQAETDYRANRAYPVYSSSTFEHSDALGFDEIEILGHYRSQGVAAKFLSEFFPDIYTLAQKIEQGLTFENAIRFFFLTAQQDLFIRPSGQLAEFEGVESHERILSSESGTQELAVLRINYEFTNEEADAAQALLADLKRILEHLPDMQIFIAVPSTQQNGLNLNFRDWPRDLVDRIKIFPHSFKWDSWAQDHSKPVVSPMATWASDRFPYDARNIESVFLPYIHSQPTHAPFEGGNVVVGDFNIFVGSKTVEKWMISLWSSRSSTKRLMEHQFGKPIVEIGSPAGQVSFHIDLDMAILRDWTSHKHREVVLLQSPVLLMERLLGTELESLLREYPDFTDAQILAYDSSRDRALRQLRAKGGTDLNMVSTLTALLRELDLYSVGMEELKYKYYEHTLNQQNLRVVRIPGTALLYDKYVKTIRRKQFRPSTGFLPFVSYANVVVSGNTALVPSYGIDFLDKPTHSEIEKLGYNVLPIHSTIHTMHWQGGIRCLSETFRHPTSLCSTTKKQPSARSCDHDLSGKSE